MTTATKNRLPSSPETAPDLDQLRTEATAAAGRLLSALHDRQARAVAELSRIESEICALEAIDRIERGITTLLPDLPAQIREPTLPPQPNGVHLPELLKPKKQRQPKPPDDLRDMPIQSLLDELSPDVRERLASDFHYAKLFTLGEIPAWILDEGHDLEDLCSVGKDAIHLLQLLREFFVKQGFAISAQSPEGLPLVWYPKAETTAGTEARGAEPAKTVSKKTKKPMPAAEMTDAEIFEAAAKQATTSIGKNFPALDVNLRDSIVVRLRAERESRTGRWADPSKPAPTPAADLADQPDPANPKPKRQPKPADQSWTAEDLRAALQEGTLSTNWKSLAKRGADDGELTRAIIEAFGEPDLSPAGDGYSVAVSPRKGPQFWNSEGGYKSKKPATLSGPALLAAVRSVLGIGVPAAAEGGACRE